MNASRSELQERIESERTYRFHLGKIDYEPRALPIHRLICRIK